MKIPTALLLLSLLNWRGRAAPPVGTISQPLEDEIMTSYLKALTKYPGSGMFTLEDVRPIQPSTRPLNAKRDVIDGRGQNPSEETGEGDEHHPNDLYTTPHSV